MPPALKALIAQIAGCGLTYALARAGWLSAGLWPLALTQAAAAAGCAALLRSARWWIPIHLGFLPAAVLATRAEIAPGWYFAGFAALVAIFWTSFRTQVPLFLSNRRTVEAVIALLPQAEALRVLDLGSGTGGFVGMLAHARPQWRVCGIEAAPAPWLASRWRTRRLDNARITHGDFFATSWSEFDVVYAFLSPVPMMAVWTKAARDLAPGAILISNSFPVPGRKPDQVVEVGDVRATQLFLYRLTPSEAGAN